MSPWLRGLAARSEPRLVVKGRLLIQKGDVGNSLFIILSGRLCAFSRKAHNSPTLALTGCRRRRARGIVTPQHDVGRFAGRS